LGRTDYGIVGINPIFHSPGFILVQDNIPSQKMDSEAPLKMLAQEFVVIFVGNPNELGWEKFPQSDTLLEAVKDDD